MSLAIMKKKFLEKKIEGILSTSVHGF